MGMEMPVAPGEGVVGRCRGLGDGGARAGDEWGRDLKKNAAGGVNGPTVLHEEQPKRFLPAAEKFPNLGPYP